MSKTKIIIVVSTFLILCVAGLLVFFLSGEESLEARIMEIFSVDGPEVSMSRNEGTIIAASAGARLHDGYSVSTGEESICHIRLDTDSLIRMDAQSRISVNRATAASLSILVDDGQVLVDVKNQSPDHEFEVVVGNNAIGVRGTLFIVGHGDAEAHVIMLEGSVYVDDELSVSAGYVVSLQDDVPLEIAPINVADLDLFAKQAILDYQERVLEAGALTEEDIAWIESMMNVPEFWTDLLRLVGLNSEQFTVHQIIGVNPYVIARFDDGPVASGDESNLQSERFGGVRSGWLYRDIGTDDESATGFRVIDIETGTDIHYLARLDGTVHFIEFSDEALQRLWGFSYGTTTKEEIELAFPDFSFEEVSNGIRGIRLSFGHGRNLQFRLDSDDRLTWWSGFSLP